MDDQPNQAMKRAGVEGPWAAGERILLLIGPDAMAASLGRAARRLSDMIMDAPWTVAHVQRPSRVTAGDPQRGVRLNEALKLAEQLGAATVVLNDDDLVAGALGLARRNNVTQIVLGRSRHGGWRRVFQPSLAPALLKASTGAALISSPKARRHRSRRLFGHGRPDPSTGAVLWGRRGRWAWPGSFPC